ncbi:hypothetical protein CVT25_005012 [Psilocybe cyanescens]|uniref:DUF6535 domain-containing protein n=1 Tax=Psilocybe cyanescens TaxID=93625 RepID=A0A409XIY4_PSICY|nr:hypothetical protein CVT25_005012 [Psilocybe cyanescens]
MSNHEHVPTEDGWKAECDQQPPSVWELHDPYQFAPPKPDGDTWRVVLEPLIKKDKMRCEAWKDEVQNLLIFAGLFSAVATAFVIESYKSLQQDPIENLVLVITSSLNSSTISVPPFTPTASSVRVNICWFLSLVLSLTTVLVGIVSLQWLREHQSYPDLTPKQILSLFHMRSEGLEKWRVPQIFATLPLLLQAALVLFFAGMIDFLFSLQSNVAIPVVVIIGLSSIFLIATTILPTLQGFPFYFPFLYLGKSPPSQCAYKSPQSQAFRMISKAAFRACSFLLPYLNTLPRKLCLRGVMVLDKHHVIPSIASTWSQGTWTQFDLAWLAIRDAYVQGIHDRQPDLSVHRRRWGTELPLYDTAKGLREVVQNEGTGSLHTDHILSAVYYCFEEVSLDIMGRSKRWNDPVDPFGDQERRNRYLRRIVEDVERQIPQGRNRTVRYTVFTPTISDFLYLNDGRGLRGWEAWEVLHHDNMLIFLSRVMLKSHPLTMLSTHVMELQMRLVRDLLGKPRKLKKDWNERMMSMDDDDISSDSPHNGDGMIRLPPSLLMDYAGFKENILKCGILEDRFAFCYQYANIVKSFFLSVVDAPSIDSEQHHQSFHAHRQMLVFMTEAGWITSYLVEMCARYDTHAAKSSLDGTSQEHSKYPTQARHMIKVLISNLIFIIERLEAEMDEMESEIATDDGLTAHPNSPLMTIDDFSFRHSAVVANAGDSSANYWSTVREAMPAYEHRSSQSRSASLLFYVACLYIKPLKQQYHEVHSPIRKVLDDIKPVMRRYYFKRRVVYHDRHISGGRPRHASRGNALLERRWGGIDEDGIRRFSDKWWEFLIGAVGGHDS